MRFATVYAEQTSGVPFPIIFRKKDRCRFRFRAGKRNHCGNGLRSEGNGEERKSLRSVFGERKDDAVREKAICFGWATKRKESRANRR